MPRPRKPARIYRRPDRPGLYAYLSRRQPHVALGTDDEEEAAHRLAELLRDRRLQQVATGDRPAAEVFTEHLTRARTNNTPKTAYEHGLNARRVLRFLLDRELFSFRDLSREVIEDYKSARRFDKAGPARINAELNTWKGAAKIAVEWGLINEGALRLYKKLREPRPEPHRIGLTKTDLAALLRAEKHPGFRALLRVVIGTGMRDEEVRHMDASDIRPGHIVVTPKEGWTTKGYRYRSIPVTKATAKAARDWIAARDSLNIDKKNVWKRIQSAAKAAKLGKRVSLHELRRAWASHMLNAGHRIEMISKLLGHADLITTMRYLRIVSEEKIDPKRLPF